MHIALEALHTQVFNMYLFFPLIIEGGVKRTPSSWENWIYPKEGPENLKAKFTKPSGLPTTLCVSHGVFTRNAPIWLIAQTERWYAPFLTTNLKIRLCENSCVSARFLPASPASISSQSSSHLSHSPAVPAGPRGTHPSIQGSDTR